MIEFEPFSLTNLKKIIPFLRSGRASCSDLSAGSLFMWHEGADVRFCIRNDTLVIRQIIGDQPAFSWPAGSDPDGMIDELLAYTANNHLPLRFFAVDNATLDRIMADPRLGNPMRATDRRWSDYVYSFAEAADFRGKKYSGQRNHINKYRSLYGEPDVRFLDPGDAAAVRALLAEYEREHEDASRLERLERDATGKLLDVYGELGMYAAGLFAGNELAAFTIGEIIGDELIIHVEKALRRYEGAYPAMYSGFVRLIGSLPGESPATVNREDDSGDPGLRTSKMQYHPAGMIDKYLVHVDSPAALLDGVPDVEGDNLILTAFRETDKSAYRKLNTDVANNRWWGYDYRDDADITGPVTDDTFYDAAVYDMRAGDSVNFAVRTCREGEMIGEVILWNFTSDRRAELGCRIMPEFQGRGYGREAFVLAADFAEKVMGLSLYARCFHENVRSRRMIRSGGFRQVCESDTHTYFVRR